MKILITNYSLEARWGTQMYVSDLARQLLLLGHKPVVYSPRLGQVAAAIREATVPVVNDLEKLSVKPDIIHGQHIVETMTALLHFPGVPAVYFCHDWYSNLDVPPKFPRIKRYVAVDDTCWDKLIYEHAVPEEQVRLIFNSVDLERFKMRNQLPKVPRRALIFGNYTKENAHLQAIREMCSRRNIELEVLGAGVGRICERPEQELLQYDVVFAKGRAALEALAVGTAVIIYSGIRCAGPMVTSAQLDTLLPKNFGVRAMTPPMAPDLLALELEKQLDRYDAEDAAAVSRRIRTLVGLDDTVNTIVALYKEVLDEHTSAREKNFSDEGPAAARFLQQYALEQSNRASRLEEDINNLENSSTIRLRNRVMKVPLLNVGAKALIRALNSK